MILCICRTQPRHSHRFHGDDAYFLANEIFMACVGVILKPCNASLAALLCSSVVNSTKAISWRFGTKRTSLKPGNWLNNIDNIISLVSSGKLVKNKIWFGGCSTVLDPLLPVSALVTLFFFLLSVLKIKQNTNKHIQHWCLCTRKKHVVCLKLTAYHWWSGPALAGALSLVALWMYPSPWQSHHCRTLSMQFALVCRRMGILA